jgi:RNA polymerase sigma-70 factor (ECF subfamily)
VSSSFPTARFPALPLSGERSADVPICPRQDLAAAEVSDDALIGRDNAEAEDFVQDFFLYIHRKAGLYDPTRGSVKTWLLHTSYYRALIRRAQLASRHYYGCVDPTEKEAEEFVDQTGPSYDRSGEGLFGRDGWRELISQLTEEQWEALRLHFYEGYTFAEIANKRNETVGNIRHHFYRELDRLRKYLDHGESRKG